MKRAVLTLTLAALVLLCGAGLANADLPPPTDAEETVTVLQPDVTDQIAADLVAMAPVWRSLGVETADAVHLSLLSEIYVLPVTETSAAEHSAPVTSKPTDYQGTVHDHRETARDSPGFWPRE